MIATFSYLGRSGLVESGSGAALNLAPNLAREPVSCDAALRKPLRFREAVSALHDIVISDLRHKKRDHSAHDAWKEEQRLAEERLRGERMKTAKAEIERRAAVPLPPGFEREFERHRSLYWKARRQYSNHLLAHDRELWRHLMPCDPVITVAPDALLFECFSAVADARDM